MLVARQTDPREKNLLVGEPSQVARDINTEMEAWRLARPSETTQFVNARLDGDRFAIGTSFAGVVCFEELANA
jgi:hypothetical protein